MSKVKIGIRLESLALPLRRALQETERLGVLGEHVEQPHHPVDDLDRSLVLGFGGGHAAWRRDCCAAFYLTM